VEAPDEEMNDEEWVEDPQEADEIVARHRPNQDGNEPSSSAGPQGGEIFPEGGTIQAMLGISLNFPSYMQSLQPSQHANA
jgi:hypothetical protein